MTTVAEFRAMYLDGTLAQWCSDLLATHPPLAVRAADHLRAAPPEPHPFGAGANSRDRACEGCGTTLPATRRRGRPRLRCPDCGGRSWSTAA